MGIYKYRKAEEMYKKVLIEKMGYKVQGFPERLMIMSPAQLLFPTVYNIYGDNVAHLQEYLGYNVLEYIQRNEDGERCSNPRYFPCTPVRLVLLKVERR